MFGLVILVALISASWGLIFLLKSQPCYDNIRRLFIGIYDKTNLYIRDNERSYFANAFALLTTGMLVIIGSQESSFFSNNYNNDPESEDIEIPFSHFGTSEDSDENTLIIHGELANLGRTESPNDPIGDSLNLINLYSERLLEGLESRIASEGVRRANNIENISIEIKAKLKIKRGDSFDPDLVGTSYKYKNGLLIRSEPDNIQIDETECSICKEDYLEDESIKLLECKHNFHKDCINIWLAIHSSCPVCRKSF